MRVDEACEYLLKSTAPSDHNSIIVDLDIGNIKQTKGITGVRLNAPSEKWRLFETELQNTVFSCNMIMESCSVDMNTAHCRSKNLINKKVHKTLGKTTVKQEKLRSESMLIKNIRREKKVAKQAFQNETKGTKKVLLKINYISKQKELRQQI